MRLLATVFTAAVMASATASAETVTAEFVGADGEPVGTAELTASPHGVLIRVEIDAGGLEPGWHGMHLHQVGDCSDHGHFQLSGGHVNPDGMEHGLLNPAGPDAGDLPNIYATEDGASRAEMFTWLTTLDALVDGDGSAIVIHANPDDHMTQPIGGAGPRVACAVVQ